MSYTLFKNESATSVRRFYHLDFYYFLLLAIYNGAKDELEAFVYFSKNESDLLAIATNPNSKEKLKSEYLINSVIFESIAFGLITDKNKSLQLTEQGEHLLALVRNKNNIEAEILLCHKMEEYYGRLSLLLNLMYEINPESGLILFPKPSPSVLGFTPSQLLNEADLEKYCKKFSHYAFNEIKRFTILTLNERDIYQYLLHALSTYLKDAKQRNVSAINFTREIKQIMYKYYIQTLFKDKFDRVSFDTWIRRAKEFKLINFSEFFPGTNSLIIYPTSKVIAAEIESSNFIRMAKTRLGEYIIRYEPDWMTYRDDFMRCLWDNYIELRKLRDDFWVTIQDLKDLVCYKLQFPESTFQQFLELAYKESMTETIRQFKISLEVDRSPEERTFVNSKRYPIFINNKPINIIGIQMR